MGTPSDSPNGKSTNSPNPFENLDKMVWKDPNEVSIRRLLDEKIQDPSFWQGVISTVAVLLLSLLSYYFLFSKAENSPSRRKTSYIKKKRSTFFKSRKSDLATKAKKPSIREVKGKFSSVIRRQLS